MHIQDTNKPLIFRVVSFHKRRVFVFFIFRLLFVLSFLFFYISFVGILNRHFVFDYREIGLLLFPSFVSLILPLIRLPSLRDTVKYLERMNPDFKGRLFLVFFPFKTEQDDNKWFNQALSESENIYFSKRVPVFDWRKFYVPSVLFILSIIIFLSSHRNLKVINPYIDVLYTKGYVAEGEPSFVLVKSNLPEVFVYGAGRREKMIKMRDFRWGIILEPDTTSVFRIGYRHYTRDIKIEVLPLLQIEQVEVKYIYPEYINVPAQIESTIPEEVNSIEGTIVRVSGMANRRLRSIEGIDNEKIHGKRFTFHIRVYKDTTYILTFEDSLNLTSDDYKIKIHCIPDEKPEIEIVYPQGDYRITTTNLVPLVFQAEDDIGLKKIGIVMERKSVKEYSITGIRIQDSIEISIKNMLPGDSVHLKLYAVDLKGQVSFSSPLLVFMPGFDEYFSEASELADTMSSLTGDIIEKQEEIKKSVENLMMKGELTPEDVSYLRETLEKQKGLIQTLENMREIAKSIQSPEFAREMERIKELLQSLDLETIKSHLPDSITPSSSLEKIKLDQENLLEMLKMGRKLLEKIRNLMDVNKAISQLEDIKEKESDILGEESPDSLTAMEQEELNRRAEKTISDMKSSDLEALQKIGEMAEEMNLKELMERFQGELKQARINRKLGTQLLKNLSSLLDKLNQLRTSMTGGEKAKKMLTYLAVDIYFTISMLDSVETERVLLGGIISAVNQETETAKRLFLTTLGFSPIVFQELEEAGKMLSDLVDHPDDIKNVLPRIKRKLALSIVLLFDTPPSSGGSMLSALQMLSNEQKSIGQQLMSLLPLPAPARSQGLKELAGKQRRLASKVRKLGDAFSSLAEEMERLADEFERGYLNQDVMKRQEKVINQFLEAIKSVRRREISKKRRSEPGKEYPPIMVELPENLGERHPFLKSLLEKRLKHEKFPPAYRKIIEDYFRRITK